ncbi:phage baseplate assembly protein V [Noviherbaspirillum cavernae]|uniref:Phage baseplate assembly protein V n=2 Tax=Noviherbaspirillum cavernae TaxID=2320862 RepID=A0A418X1B1_9BURK|nr:phage baseplate assembly protein V [Noviherbaspirillum cavernae]
MLGPTNRRLSNMLVRGTVITVKPSQKMQRLQAKLLDGETADDLEHFEPYGYTSRPKQGAEVLAMFFDGDRSHGVVIVAADRRYRLKGLKDGEVAMYDDLGQKIHLTRNGIIIDGAGMDVTIQNAPVVHVPQDLRVVRDIVAGRDVKDQGGTKSMAGMRTSFDQHKHPGDSGGTTGTPTQGM